MSWAKQAPIIENNILGNVILHEISSLKENNRDLAKCLAEKNKEIFYLRDIENKYNIIETKFKMNQEQNASTISKLIAHFTRTFSIVLNAVKSLSVLHDTLHEGERLLCLSTEANEKEDETELENEDSVLLKVTPSLRHVDHILKRLCTSYPPVSLSNTTDFFPHDTEKLSILEEEDPSERKISAQNKLSILQQLGRLIVHHYDGSNTNEEQKLTNSESYIKSNSENDAHRKTPANSEDMKRQTICPKDLNEFETITLSDTSHRVTREDTILFLNENYEYHPTEKQLVDSTGNETFHFSQDDAFQNFFSDDETIVRKGTDVLLLLQGDCLRSTYHTNTPNSTLTSNVKDFIYRDEGFESNEKHKQGKINKNVQLNFLNHYVNVLPITDISNIDEVGCNELRPKSKTHVASENYVTQMPQTSVSDPTMDLESLTSAFVDHVSSSKEVFNYSHSFMKTELCQPFCNIRNVNDEYRRKSGGSKLCTFSSDSRSPKEPTKLFPFLNYKYKLTLNLETHSPHVVNNKRHIGKENRYNTVGSIELSQLETKISRTSSQNNQKEIRSIKHDETKFERENINDRFKNQHGLKEVELLEQQKTFCLQKDLTPKKQRTCKKKTQINSKKSHVIRNKNLRL